MRRRSEEGCLSDLRLDRLLAGELDLQETRELEAHLAKCSPCHERHRLLQAEQLSFAALDLPLKAGSGGLSRQSSKPGPGQKKRRRAIGFGFGAFSMAAAAAMALLRLGESSELGPEHAQRPATERATPETRTKGASIALSWVVRRGSRVLATRTDEPVHPGDALRFTVRVDTPGQVAILSLDGERQVSVYQDWVPVEVGDEQPLSGAVELDGVLGAESVYAILCRQAWPLSQLKAAILKRPSRPELPAGCGLQRALLRKEPP